MKLIGEMDEANYWKKTVFWGQQKTGAWRFTLKETTTLNVQDKIQSSSRS